MTEAHELVALRLNNTTHSRPDQPKRGGASLYRIEFSVLVSAVSEDEAERIGASVIRGGDGDARSVELYSRVAVKDADEVFREEDEDGEVVSVSFLDWLTAPLTEEESAAAYRVQLEEQGQATLPGLTAHA